ncbi:MULTISPECIES: CHAT domain-containing protein [unclassified Bradyrhizobium]|uniref:CHAT domain-containing protein n=1 Tax=unclassified Bradyrhizobium TaxID=2631580 RepID=UPI001CD29C0B|nr:MULTISPECIES: CHAT domain-containing protein [unclassified Bradyrhizobium]MCA1425990.1 CHAT domain-containing protein [Bradyrhizobium sp. NBAIM16]MCA1503351.1 CHAT domain-containing protein [Bradyrhizobium sp. NBAIM02]
MLRRTIAVIATQILLAASCNGAGAAPQSSKRAVSSERKAAPITSFAEIAALQGQFDASIERNDYDHALSLAPTLENAIVRYFGANSLEHSVVLQQVGSALNGKSEARKASLKCRQALAIGEAVMGARNPALRSTLECLAKVADLLQDEKAGIEWYARISTLLPNRGTLSESDMRILFRLAYLYTEQDLHEQAIAVRRRIIAALEVMPPDKQRGQLDFHLLKLGESEFALGKTSDARDHMRQALKLREQYEGENSATLAIILYELGRALNELKSYDETVVVSRRAIELVESSPQLGPDNPFLELPLSNLVVGSFAAGQNDEAILAAERIVKLKERQFGQREPRIVPALQKLLRLQVFSGKYPLAIATQTRIIAIAKEGGDTREARSGHLLLAELLDIVGQYAESEAVLKDSVRQIETDISAQPIELLPFLDRLANVCLQQGRYSAAGGYLQRAVGIAQSAGNKVGLVNTLNSFGLLLYETERVSEARAVFERAYALQRQLSGTDDSPELLRLLNNRAITAESSAVAGTLLGRALAIAEKHYAPDSFELVGPLVNLAVRLNEGGEFDRAAATLERAIAIQAKVSGSDSPELIEALVDLSFSHRERDPEGAIKILKRALAICERRLPAYHPNTVRVLDQLSTLMTKTKRYEAAVDFGRRAVELVLKHSAQELSIDDHGSAKNTFDSRIGVFRNLAIALTLSSRVDMDTYERNGRELFEIAQWVSQSTASIAMKQMTVRLGTQTPGIAAIVRERQDALAERDRWRGELSKAAGLPATNTAPPLDALARIENRLLELNRRLKRDYPAYFDIAGLRPTSVTEVQESLRADEALVSIWQIKGDIGLVFAVSADRFEWEYIDVPNPEVRIKSFRSGLLGNDDASFDAGNSYNLYQQTLGKMENVIRDKRNLLIAPAGVWTALPFHLLVTKPPLPALAGQPQVYSEASWLISHHAVSVLPSVSSLDMFRNASQGGLAPRPLVGFGNPSFTAEGKIRQSTKGRRATSTAAKRVSVSRSYGEFWKGVEIDREKLSMALTPLPDSQQELTSVAKAVGADTSSLYFGPEASETAVKRNKLSDYRIVYFATHGLVAGDVKGIAEPSLALTLPKDPSELDDGLLTSSEISQLKLNADWVVLSACNTLAGDVPGGEALSGLARSFFYAGARSVLASHWAVESEAAVRLTTETFKLLQQAPKMRRSEALRQAMLNALKSGGHSANPSYWGAFALIGE